MKIRLTALIFAALLTLYSEPSSAFAQHELQSVQADGSATVINNNLARAQNAAIADALKNAVEKAVIQLLPPDIVTQNSQILRTKIYNMAENYVQTYKIVSEAPSQQLYSVSLISTIDGASLKRELIALKFTVSQLKNDFEICLVFGGIKSNYVYARFLGDLRKIGALKKIRFREAHRETLNIIVDSSVPASVLANKLSESLNESLSLNQINDKCIRIGFWN